MGAVARPAGCEACQADAMCRRGQEADPNWNAVQCTVQREPVVDGAARLHLYMLLHPNPSHPSTGIDQWTEIAIRLRAAQELALAPGQVGCCPALL